MKKILIPGENRLSSAVILIYKPEVVSHNKYSNIFLCITLNAWSMFTQLYANTNIWNWINWSKTKFCKENTHLDLVILLASLGWTMNTFNLTTISYFGRDNMENFPSNGNPAKMFQIKQKSRSIYTYYIMSFQSIQREQSKSKSWNVTKKIFFQ